MLLRLGSWLCVLCYEPESAQLGTRRLKLGISYLQPLIWYALDRAGYCFPKAREFCALLTASAAAVERAATSSGTMGCMNSKDITPEMREQGKHSAAIDKVIRADKKKYDRTVKILLLGMSGHFIRLFSLSQPFVLLLPGC